MAKRRCGYPKCEEWATSRLTNDLDIEGVPMCDKHKDEMQSDFFYLMVASDKTAMEYIEDKYNVNLRDSE